MPHCPDPLTDHAARLAMSAPTPTRMDQIGRALAAGLTAGDTVALSGPLGAGKSHLARAVIRARLDDQNADVPSPSYTLVNIYDAAGGEIWHADLYRIADPAELTEIGLDEATGNHIVLIEWPERWTGLPARRLDIAITPDASDGRDLDITAHGPGWQGVLDALGALG